MKKIIFTIITMGATALAGFLAAKTSDIVWRMATKKKPPQHADKPSTRWRDALLWSGLTGLMGGLSAITVQRTISIGFQRLVKK